MAFSEYSTLGELLSNKAAAGILEKHLPGVTTNPMASMGKRFTLKQLSAFPQANIPEKVLSAIVADLANIDSVDTIDPHHNNQIESQEDKISLNGSVAIVTGAGGGIGRAASLKLSQAGFKVVAVDFNAATGEETLRLIRKQGGEGVFVQADVSKEEDVERYTNAAIEAYGRIDVFFNNAGILQKFSLIEDLDPSEFDRIMNVNVRGVFLGLKKVLKVMKGQGFGSIINTA